jgi:hypothetical protein
MSAILCCGSAPLSQKCKIGGRKRGKLRGRFLLQLGHVMVSWYNNGIFILCDDASRHSVVVAGAVVQIVAGKQWSWCRGAARVLKRDLERLDFHMMVESVLVLYENKHTGSLLYLGRSA